MRPPAATLGCPTDQSRSPPRSCPSHDLVVAEPPRIGYTSGMKIAVSVPDDVFQEAEELARRMRRSRSEVYSRALAEYIARHAPDRVTEAMDRVVAEVGEPADEFVGVASRRVLKRSDW
jgi:predicted transcriptional regulator